MSLVKRFEAAARQRDAYWLEETRLLAARLRHLLHQRDDLLKELTNIAHADRFNAVIFDSDSSFSDWAQSRARAAIAKAVGEPVAPG